MESASHRGGGTERELPTRNQIPETRSPETRYRCPSKTAICLLNMGGPDSLKAVRPFLYNLFSDREIIRLGPLPLQRPIAWCIATMRAPKSSKNYALIGGRSPIRAITEDQARLLEERLRPILGEDKVGCFAAMRYWHPRTPKVLEDIKKAGFKRVLGLSLYPHFSKATSGSSLEEFKKAAVGQGLEWGVVDSYPTHPAYIQALEDVLKEGIKKAGDQDLHLVYSAHSLPKIFIQEGDPYLQHIKATIEALEARTGIHGTLAFQSRSGPVEWLEPATDQHLLELVRSGKKRILCLPISFVSDHIETLYEIEILFKGIVEAAGGELFMTPGLNTRASFVDALFEITMARLKEMKWLR